LIVATPFRGILQILEVADYLIAPNFLRIWVWQWDWDGNMMLKVKYELRIEKFRGTREVAELPYYPLACYEKHKELCVIVRERSLQFIKATTRCSSASHQVFRYDGLAYAHLTKIFPDEKESIDVSHVSHL
jgi:hypothetical protein